MNELSEGIKVLKAWVADSDGYTFEVGKNGCTGMTISMQHGQMSKVPWVLVWSKAGLETMLNCASLKYLDLAKKDA